MYFKQASTFIGQNILQFGVSMDNWMILTKFSILIFCIIKYGVLDTKNVVTIILCMLCYVCITMLYYIFKNNWFKNITIIITIILLISASYYLDLFFILFVPVSIFEMAGRFKISLIAPITFVTIIIATIYDKILPEYILTALLSCQVYLLSNKIYYRMEIITKENDVLREKNHLLSGRLNKDSEYGNQLKHLSQLEERNKIAQEIHDRVGHTISGSLMLLEATKLIMTKDKEKAELMVQNAIDKLREGMESIRATLRNIKPATEQIGINRLKLLLDEFALDNQIKTSMVYKGNLGTISYLYWKIMNENIGEALTNALKYSRATSISLNIEVLNKFVKLEIKDNGVGTLKVVKGLGIKGIEERTGIVGGKVIIDGSNGFSIITLLPQEEGKNAD